MGILPEGNGTGRIEVVCPSCDGLLNLEPTAQRELNPGAPIRLFCPTCATTVEVVAPAGIQAVDQAPVDQATQKPASEFLHARPQRGGA